MGRRRSKRRSLGALVAAPVVLLALISIDRHLAEGATDAGTASCVKVTSAARYVPFGYNHVVTLTSTCPREALCSVATDVAPEPRTIAVPRGATVEVLTFMASPSQTFTAQVACSLR